jgi:hypothetical protein
VDLSPILGRDGRNPIATPDERYRYFLDYESRESLPLPHPGHCQERTGVAVVAIQGDERHEDRGS